MVENDFTQLPVVDANGCLLGLLTSDSILRALGNFQVPISSLRVSHALIKAPRFRVEDDLFELLDDLRGSFAVVVVDDADQLVGIITSHDSNEYFRRRAEDFMFVEDIEGYLRQHIMAAYASEGNEVNLGELNAAISAITGPSQEIRRHVQSAIGRYVSPTTDSKAKVAHEHAETVLNQIKIKQINKNISDLTFYEYMQLILAKGKEDYCQEVFGVSVPAIRTMLDGVRETRNDLAHFQGEISPVQRNQLHYCAEWFENHLPPFDAKMPLVDTATEKLVDTSHSSHTDKEEPSKRGNLVDIRAKFPELRLMRKNDGRFAPLIEHLLRLPESRTIASFTFDEIETIIGSKLSNAAKEHSSWWMSSAYVHTNQWLNIGWVSEGISRIKKSVTFTRRIETPQERLEFLFALNEELEADNMGYTFIKFYEYSGLIIVSSSPGDKSINIEFAPEGNLIVTLLCSTTPNSPSEFSTFPEDHRGFIEAVLGSPVSYRMFFEGRMWAIDVTSSLIFSFDNRENESTRLVEWAIEKLARFTEIISHIDQEFRVDEAPSIG